MDALKGSVVSVDSEPSTVQVGVKFPATVDNGKQLSLSVGILSCYIGEGLACEGNWLGVLEQCNR